MTSNDLIEQSLLLAEQNKNLVEQKFLSLPIERLNKKQNPDTWSATECFQHLLFTNEGYLKHFNEVVSRSQDANKIKTFNHSVNHPFKHSLWGKFILYFVKPTTKMKSKTTKPFNPALCKVDKDVVRKYLEQNNQLIDAISKMKNLNLQNIKMPSPINEKIKYNLGDAIKILVMHDQRHIQQAERAIRKII
jgi:hypothetical protein